jgi:branched-chain amino acid aminotransferase
MPYNFTIEKTANPTEKPDPATLKFGKTFTDHMFLMEYAEGEGWHNGRIVPYAPLALDPAAAVLHYSQQMFEGLKAYRAVDGRVLLFRPDKNAERMVKTNARMCIPKVEPELFIEAVKALVNVERDWIPDKEGTSLYIRPFIYADEAFLGVHPAHHFQFVIICSPVGSYYDSGDGELQATTIYVEEEYVRAVKGGTGFAKVGGNYAASLKAQEKAAKNGAEQVMWLDAREHTYVEEIGTSNAFIVMDNIVYTAPLINGTILPGVTRDSVLELLKKWGVEYAEKQVNIKDIERGVVNDPARGVRVTEIFASGTAAVISPVGHLAFWDDTLAIAEGAVGPIAKRLYEALSGIQTGKLPDDMGWTVEV